MLVWYGMVWCYDVSGIVWLVVWCYDVSVWNLGSLWYGYDITRVSWTL